MTQIESMPDDELCAKSFRQISEAWGRKILFWRKFNWHNTSRSCRGGRRNLSEIELLWRSTMTQFSDELDLHERRRRKLRAKPPVELLFYPASRKFAICTQITCRSSPRQSSLRLTQLHYLMRLHHHRQASTLFASATLRGEDKSKIGIRVNGTFVVSMSQFSLQVC